MTLAEWKKEIAFLKGPAKQHPKDYEAWRKSRLKYLQTHKPGNVQTEDEGSQPPPPKDPPPPPHNA